MLRVTTLKNRADFIAVSRKGRSFSAPGFILQSLKNDLDGHIRLGFTVSRKVGNAVERNRVKRRLRHVAFGLFRKKATPNHDYVIIGKRNALKIEYDDLVKDMQKLLDKSAT